jgi:hypothetical protein
MKKLIALFICFSIILSATSALAQEPRREDIGDLIVLHLYGSYREMGRQQAELLGSDLEKVYDLQLANYEKLVAEAGAAGWFLNSLTIPVLTGLAPLFEDSSLYDELAGMASVLDVPRRNVFRALLSLAAGSTVFAATGNATADGRALIGRNVDWNDGFGLRKPVVKICHPDNGDLDYISVGWPLVNVPTVGLNEAGLAISFNFFVTDPEVSFFFPEWPHRRAVQKARTVEEAIQIITKPRRRAIAAFLVLADAAGDIAMVECTPTKCAVFRPGGNWFGQANHARTPEMIPHDKFRHPDSFLRRAGMENAVRPHLGSLTPARAAEILRDRTGEVFANTSTVGNLAVLNAAVVHPASGTLWHSTTMQPHAPFGEYVPFTFAADTNPPTFPASEALTGERFEKEREEIRVVREALKLHRDGNFKEAEKAWNALMPEGCSTLDSRRLAFGVALTKDKLGDNEGAFEILEGAADESAPFDVRAIALVTRGILADRLGRRQPAIKHYEETLEHLAPRPEFTTFDSIREIAQHGIETPQLKTPLPLGPYDTGVPQ